MIRLLRRFIEIALPISGTIKVFGAVIFLHSPALQLPAVAIGLLLIHMRTWNVARAVLPTERKFQALRHEVDHFIQLVRRLNAAAVGMKESESESARIVFEDAQRRMRESMDRMALLAGATDEEAAALKLAPAQVAAQM